MTRRPWVFGAGVAAACAAHSIPRTPPGIDEPRYELHRHFEGLNEDVLLVKTPERVYVVRADRSELSYMAFLDEERSAYRQRFGNVSPESRLRIDAAHANDHVPLAVEFEIPDVDWDDYALRIQLEGGGGAARELTVRLAEARRRIVPMLESQGLQVTAESMSMPMVFGRAAGQSIRQLRRVEGVTLHVDDAGHEFVDAAPNSVTHPHIDVAFGQNGTAGSYAATQKIGILEGWSAPIYDSHEAFAFNSLPVSYLSPPSIRACGQCVPGDEVCSFSGSRCESVHTSHVASVISAARQGQPWSSAQAQLFLHNGTAAGGGGGVCTLSGRDAAYNAFRFAGVSVVNMSFSCFPGAGMGQVEDYYARVFGIHTAQSDANTGSAVPPPACPWTLNANCVAATTAANGFFSGWSENPGDRDEPDVVALGENVDVLDFNGPTTWYHDSGTSFATPIIASTLALLRERCLNNGRVLTPRAGRAILRQAGWGRNIAGWRYETPAKTGKFDNGEDGGGYALADWAAPWCDPNTPNITLGDAAIRLSRGMPGPTGNAPPSGPPPQAVKEGVRLQSSTAPGPSDGRKYQLLASYSLSAGQRLRVVVTWDACATIGNDPPATAIPDFDVFLYTNAPPVPRYYYSSQSFDDNVEGFDVTVSDSGTYDVYLAWPIGAVGCGGSSTVSVSWTTQWL